MKSGPAEERVAMGRFAEMASLNLFGNGSVGSSSGLKAIDV